MPTIFKSNTSDGKTIYYKALLSSVYTDENEIKNLNTVINEITNLVSANTTNISANESNISTLSSSLSTHAANKKNPHGITAAQIGLDKVNNTADSSKTVSTAKYVMDYNTINSATKILLQFTTTSATYNASIHKVAVFDGSDILPTKTSDMLKAHNVLTGKLEGGFYCIVTPDGSDQSFIRTPKSGIIPYATTNSSTVGTSSWQFDKIYGKTIYENGTTLSSKYAAASHTHSYLPLTGGVVTGTLQVGQTYIYGNHVRSKPNPATAATRTGMWIEAETGSVYIAAGARYFDNASYASDESVQIFAGRPSATTYALDIRRMDQSTLGTIHAAGVYTTSSRKTKKNIKPMSCELADKILDIEIVTFDYKKKFGGAKDNRGVIAEDVRDIIPEAVICADENKDDGLSVDYSKFIPYLIKKVQMMQEEINKLKNNK